MYYAKEIRWALFLISALLFGVLLVNAFWVPAPPSSQAEPCLGVPVVAPEDIPEETSCPMDYIDRFLFNGEKAAVDGGSKTIYIPQPVSQSTTREDLTGALTISVPNQQLYFLEDANFENLPQAVAQGHGFTVAVTHGRHSHFYHVVFTTLPVLRMESQTKQEQENGVPEVFGQMCLWDVDGNAPVTSELFFHARGDTSLRFPKKSWKLSLKTSSLKNNHVSLLGLGSDDDWILNAMFMDDTKLKENFLTQIWNALAEQSSWNEPMSACEYVEVILDGSYQGVYLLQRRVDQKYLDLSDEDVLFKGYGTASISSFQEAFEIKYSHLPNDEAYALVKGLYAQADVSSIDVDNFVDISIFLQLGCLCDNASYKNMYYCLKKEASGYRLTMIPWDADLALGVTWLGDYNGYDYEYALSKEAKRQEYAQIALYPDLEERIQERWQKLRKDVLSTQNLLGQMEELIQRLGQSGAYSRDIQRWGLYHEGPDTQEAAVRFLEERLILLDGLYE